METNTTILLMIKLIYLVMKRLEKNSGSDKVEKEEGKVIYCTSYHRTICPDLWTATCGVLLSHFQNKNSNFLRPNKSSNVFSFIGRRTEPAFVCSLRKRSITSSKVESLKLSLVDPLILYEHTRSR
jgi:hypothetical protein